MASGTPLSSLALAPGTFGVYVHVPFCTKRCDYCAFATWTDRGHLVDDYVDAVVADVERAVEQGMAAATSVFFGGGTPSLLAPDALARIVTAIPRTADAEVTVECNPDTVGPAHFDRYLEAGVNRLSFGVQSMVDRVLVALGRTHDRANVARVVGEARAAGFRTFNLDLIYGGAGETVDDWRATLEEVVALDPPHVSAYALTVEAGTPLAADPDRHPDDDDQADKYDLADDLLGAAGLRSYEISNWARPGHECRHNWLYWAQGDYRGFGCAAHSHQAGRRWWNVRTPERYVSLVGSGGDVEAASETLTDDDARVERLQLGLRTRAGVATDAFDGDDLAELLGLGLVEADAESGTVRLTRAGRLMANAVSIRIR